jgi:outer membrane protein assembly complex protein YaeT
MRSIASVALLLISAPLATALAQNGPLVVRGLKFTGNKAIDATTLEAAIATTKSAWLARSPLIRWLGLGEKRYLRERDVAIDSARIEVIYKYSGYFDVQVRPEVERSSENAKVTFRITEGEPTRVRSITFEGLDSVPDRERLLRDLPLTVDDPYSQFLIRMTVDTLALRLRNGGYPTAIVDISADADPVTQIASVTFIATPGTAAVFGDVQVSGTEDVDSAFVASLVATRPGRPYRLDALYRSQRTLYSSELFRFASVAIDTTSFKPGDKVVPLAVAVTEGRTHQARASLGYGTNDCVRASAGWTARNFLGNGRVVDVSGRLSKIGVGSPLGFGAEESICPSLKADTVGSRLANFGVDVTLRRYGFLSADNSLALTVFSERRSEYAVYLREDVGAQVSITRETVNRVPVTLGYRISYGQTQANQVSFCQFFNACVAEDVAQLRERRVLTTVTLSAERQRVNNLIEPTRGNVVSGELTVSSRFLGSSRLQQFTRLVGNAAMYRPLSRSLVLAGRLKGGVILAPEIDLAGGRANFIPPDQRFYAGGPNDLRGYDRNELGPVVYVVPRDSLDIQGADTTYNSSALRVAATGGDRVAIANLELRFPAPFLSSRFKLAAFVDAGALWSAIGTAGLRVTPGVGVRVASPLGPVRFDFGYNPYELERGAVYTSNDNGDLVQINPSDRRDRNRNFTIHFSIGHAF